MGRAGAITCHVVVGLFAAGCEYPGDGSLLDDEDVQDGGTAGGQSVSVQPTTGPWRVTPAPPLFNDCTFTTEPFLVPSDFTLSSEAPGTTSALTFTPAIGPGFACSLSGLDMTCGEITVAEEDLGFVDTAGAVNVSVQASFRGASTLDGIFRGNISCDGIGCATASTTLGVVFPCPFAIPFTAVAL